MTHRVVVAEHGGNYSKNPIMLDALVHSSGEIEWRCRDAAAEAVIVRLADALKLWAAAPCHPEGRLP